MRRFANVVFALTVVAFFAPQAMAQFFQRGGGGQYAILNLLNNKSVQKELKLEASDVAKVPDAVMAALGKVLKPDQLKRLKQIELQVRGQGAFSDPKVQKALKFTDEQKESMTKIQKEAREEIRELFQGGGGGGDFAAMREKMAKMQKATMKKMLETLTSDQKKSWKSMVGEPFELKVEQRPMRPRRGRGDA